MSNVTTTQFFSESAVLAKVKQNTRNGRNGRNGWQLLAIYKPASTFPILNLRRRDLNLETFVTWLILRLSRAPATYLPCAVFGLCKFRFKLRFRIFPRMNSWAQAVGFSPCSRPWKKPNAQMFQHCKKRSPEKGLLYLGRMSCGFTCKNVKDRTYNSIHLYLHTNK